MLVSEDDEVIRGIIVETLQEQGYTTLEAADGVQALAVAVAHAEPIHLLVTDVVMPRMGGAELAKRLAAGRPALRVLYLSGYSDRAIDLQAGPGAGACFLQKPFNPTSLARKVREVLDTTSSGLTIGPVVPILESKGG